MDSNPTLLISVLILGNALSFFYCKSWQTFATGAGLKLATQPPAVTNLGSPWPFFHPPTNLTQLTLATDPWPLCSKGKHRHENAARRVAEA